LMLAVLTEKLQAASPSVSTTRVNATKIRFIESLRFD
jgi:hypothetical protein